MDAIGKQRDLYFQSLKGLCIILVVFIHLPIGQEYNWSSYLWISTRKIINFPVATFFFLSAYYCKSYIELYNYGILNFYRKRFKRLLIPYCIWGILYIFILPLLREHHIPQNWLFLFLTGYGPSYFLLTLTQFTILTPLLQKYKYHKKYNLIFWCITPLYLTFYYYYNFSTDTEFKPEQFFCFPWFIFYYLGLKIQNTEIRDKIFNKKRPLKFFFLTIFTLIFSLIESFFIFTNSKIYSFAISQITIGSIIYSLSIILLFYQIKFIQEKVDFLSKFGDFSIGILLIHPFYNWVYKFLIIHYCCKIIDYSNIYGQILSHLTILFLSVLSSYVTAKYLYKYLPQYSLYLGLK